MFSACPVANGDGILQSILKEKFLKESKNKEAPPYPGAKPVFLIEDKIEDRDWLSELIRITVDELPEPKQKKKKDWVI